MDILRFVESKGVQIAADALLVFAMCTSCAEIGPAATPTLRYVAPNYPSEIAPVPTPDDSIPTTVVTPISTPQAIETNEAGIDPKRNQEAWAEIPQELKNNAVYIKIYNSQGQHKNDCSGTLVNRGVLTAQHCILQTPDSSMIDISQPQLTDGFSDQVDISNKNVFYDLADHAYIIGKPNFPVGLSADQLVANWLPATDQPTTLVAVGFGDVDGQVGTAIPARLIAHYNPAIINPDRQFGYTAFDTEGTTRHGDSGEALYDKVKRQVVSALSQLGRSFGFSQEFINRIKANR